MPIECCPHCFTSVIFNESTLCPCCGKDKDSTSFLSRDEFEAQQAKEGKQIICNSLLKRARACFITGGILFTIFLLTTILSLFVKVSCSIFITGIIASIIILLRGLKDILDRNKLKKAINT